MGAGREAEIDPLAHRLAVQPAVGAEIGVEHRIDALEIAA
jgi:hypothetical protein